MADENAILANTINARQYIQIILRSPMHQFIYILQMSEGVFKLTSTQVRLRVEKALSKILYCRWQCI